MLKFEPTFFEVKKKFRLQWALSHIQFFYEFKNPLLFFETNLAKILAQVQKG